MDEPLPVAESLERLGADISALLRRPRMSAPTADLLSFLDELRDRPRVPDALGLPVPIGLLGLLELIKPAIKLSVEGMGAELVLEPAARLIKSLSKYEREDGGALGPHGTFLALDAAVRSGFCFASFGALTRILSDLRRRLLGRSRAHETFLEETCLFFEAIGGHAVRCLNGRHFANSAFWGLLRAPRLMLSPDVAEMLAELLLLTQGKAPPCALISFYFCGKRDGRPRKEIEFLCEANAREPLVLAFLASQLEQGRLSADPRLMRYVDAARSGDMAAALRIRAEIARDADWSCSLWPRPGQD